MPTIGRIVLTAMLNEQGRIVGEFTVARVGEDEFFLFGSQAAEVHHSRWFLDHLPADGSVAFEVLGLLARRALARRSARPRRAAEGHRRRPRPPPSFRFMDFRQVDLGMIPARVGRLTYSGDLGYELWVAPEYQRALFDRLMEAGEEFGIRCSASAR